jgi:hypothetical protein
MDLDTWYILCRQETAPGLINIGPRPLFEDF